MSLLELDSLKVHFPVRPRLFARARQFVRAVDGVSLSIAPGETVGLVGESGCGKTTLGRAALKLVEPTAGLIWFEGEDITGLKGPRLRSRRRHISQRICVMYLGRIVEAGPAREICRSPQHPYTKALISAIPSLHPDSKRKRMILSGDLPSPLHPPGGGPFHTRCPIAQPRCKTDVPPLREIAPARQIACHLVQ